jgi:hypothetical protein
MTRFLGQFLGVVGATLSLAAAAAEDRRPASGIEQIDLVHFSHTDYGFTDHPVVCRELQKRFLDLALDAVRATRDAPEEGRFRWTAETTVAVDDWWQTATPQRRGEFVEAVRSGQLEVAALPHNQTATLNRQQWHTMLHWLPEDVWQQLQPRTAVQNDVNGFPRAGAMALLDRAVPYLFSGINEDSGGAPMRRPTAFWWKMPDGRKMLVYLNYSYPAGYWFFEPDEWRRGPVPRAGDTRYRPPRAGDFLGNDEASVRKAHAHLVRRLEGLRADGYAYPVLILSITNQWRIDNDPPFAPLADFVAAWKRLGLRPALRLSTATAAMKRLETAVGTRLPVHEGEWTDWWVNGVASGPREVAASRAAKRLLAAAESPLWGELDPNASRTRDSIYKELCLFDEHTWGSADSVAFPYSLDTLGQYSEKAGLAYRGLARAEWFLAQRVRTRLAAGPEGLYVGNTARLPYSGWVRMPATALRDRYQSVENPSSGRATPIEFEPGPRPFTRPENPGHVSIENTAVTFPDRCAGQTARFWVERLDGGTIRPLRMSTKTATAEKPTPAPAIQADKDGWPTSITWKGMRRPLFLPGFGDLTAVEVRGFAPRWVIKDIWAIGDAKQREAARKEKLQETPAAAAGRTEVAENPHTVVCTQSLRHPRLRWATRVLEVWKGEPRVRLTLRLNRISSEAPEVLLVTFPLPCEGRLPSASNGGQPFVPFTDQLPGTCRDYFAVDSWVRYETPEGNWVWATRDAPLVSFGSQPLLARRQDAPGDAHRLLAMVFNSFWYTNFVGDSHGAMEFQFDLAWREKVGGPAEADGVAESLLAEPQVLINPGLPESRAVIERLYRP